VYQVPSQRGKLIVVTGANSGTGKEITRRLAGAGAEVIMAVRNTAKGEDAKNELLAGQPDARLSVRLLDLADLTSVKTFAETLHDEGRPLDALVNNAGVMVPPKRFETVDGFELQMGTNFLGPFALTLRLLPLLGGPDARVCTVSSTAAIIGRLHFDDPQWHTRYRPSSAYAQSKLADLVFALHLAEIARERDWPLMSNAAHPGYTRTNLMTAGASLGHDRTRRRWVNRAAFFVSQSVESGAEPILYATASPDAFSGAYYGPNRVIVGSTTLARPPRSARSPELGPRLFALAEELTGVSLPN
jgi:NAD(P)-dependent dehydrogenase (short-subunit alcohol dehydrogenase family)